MDAAAPWGAAARDKAGALLAWAGRLKRSRRPFRQRRHGFAGGGGARRLLRAGVNRQRARRRPEGSGGGPYRRGGAHVLHAAGIVAALLGDDFVFADRAAAAAGL